MEDENVLDDATDAKKPLATCDIAHKPTEVRASILSGLLVTLTPMSTDLAYVRWRDNIPYLYDWITHSHFTWPALSFAWGGVVGVANPAPALVKGEDWRATQTIVRSVYFSTRTGTIKSCATCDVGLTALWWALEWLLPQTQLTMQQQLFGRERRAT